MTIYKIVYIMHHFIYLYVRMHNYIVLYCTSQKCAKDGNRWRCVVLRRTKRQNFLQRCNGALSFDVNLWTGRIFTTHHPPSPHQLGYFEDGFDDNGWGCAYRSLQTCVSWYRLQHYSEELVPSIPEIQRLLKRIDEVPCRDAEGENSEMVGT